MRICLAVLLTGVTVRPIAGLHNSSAANPVQDFEKLDKYAHCDAKCDDKVCQYMVYQRNLGLSPKAVLKAGHDAGLTQQETVSIFGWTLGDFEFINKIAWGKENLTFGVEPFGFPHCTLYKAEVVPYIEVLVSALQKLPPAKPATLWRGSKKTAEQLGKVITGGFSSTSHDFDSALAFVKYGGGSLWAIEGHTSGKEISMFSDKPAEDEVLFPAGSALEVVECSPSTIDDAIRQKVKAAEKPSVKIDIICMKGASPVLVDSDSVIV